MKLAITTFAIVLGVSSMYSQSSGTKSPAPVSLASLRDTHRPLLIFTPDTNTAFLTQIRALSSGAHDLHERDIVAFPLLLHKGEKRQSLDLNFDHAEFSIAEEASLRHRFRIAPNSFTVILIGKDGEEKLRSTKPIALEKLRSTIDAMPMRQEEMKQH
jgi:hypothetical protein